MTRDSWGMLQYGNEKSFRFWILVVERDRWSRGP